MATNRLSFGGQVLPCYIERFPAIKKAARKFRQYNIPGRNGDIFFQSDAYENVIQPYQVYCGDDHYGAQMDWGELAKYLYLDGYQILKDTYDPEHFRKAVFNGPLDVENSWNTHGRATLEFNCRPERYRVDGANPITYGHQTASVHLWDFDDLSAWCKSDSMLGHVDTDYVWAVSVPQGQQNVNRTLKINWINDGQLKTYCKISPGTEATAQSGTRTASRYTEITVGWTAVDILIPDIYFDEYPVIEIDGVAIGNAGTLKNPYMPSYPDIMLHNVASYSGEEMVFQINNKTVYIEYDQDTPYYFIDTENMSVTSSDSLTGERALANNVYISPDFRLQTGDNNIITTEYYDVTITPNWWEL